MVFDFLATLAGLATSALAFIIAAAIFASGDIVLMAVFAAALIALWVIVGLLRTLFSPKGKGLLNSMKDLNHSGKSLKKILLGFKESMEREVISSSTARLFAFGAIAFLFSGNILLVYVVFVAAFIVGIIMMLSHRNTFVDVMCGALIGAAVGFAAYTFIPLLLPAI